MDIYHLYAFSYDFFSGMRTTNTF